MPLIRYTGLQPRPETPFTGTGLVWYPGESRQIEDGTRARQLLNAGFGWEFLKDSDVAGPFVASKVASMDALMSPDGNLTAAELLTTTGTPGQTVRLSDGDDKGAILIWAIPEGASAYTWCWWLWPQASYL